MLTHGNLASNLESRSTLSSSTRKNVGFSFLPLSHITARHLDYAMFHHGVTIAYCPNIDDLPATLLADSSHSLRRRPARLREDIQQVQRNVRTD